MRRVILVFSISIGWLQGAHADSATLNALFAERNGQPYVNGGAIVARDGQADFAIVSGMADIAAGTPLERDTPFQTASASKPFTSTAILLLRERGRIDLDAPVAQYLPAFPFKDVRVRHLLTHTSGLPDLELFEEIVAADPQKIIGLDDVVPALVAWKQALPFQPGDKFAYSNTNYTLLAKIVEVVSGAKFGDFVRDNIFKPAGMTSTFVLGTSPLEAGPAPARNHVMPVMFRATAEDVTKLALKDERLMRRFRYETFNLGSTVGDQNVFSTLDDLVKFDHALSGGLLSEASLKDAYAPVKLNDGSTYLDAEEYTIYGVRCSYGMGWEVCNNPARGQIAGHVGYNRGIAVVFYRNLTTHQTFAMFDNADGSDFADKFISLVNVANGEAPRDVSFKKPLTRAVGEALIAKGKVEAMALYSRLKADDEHWIGTPAGLNRLGYDLLFNGYGDLALTPFEMNVAQTPGDANFWDSYGDGLAGNGRRADALVAYRRALEIDASREGTAESIKRVEAEIAGGAAP